MRRRKAAQRGQNHQVSSEVLSHQGQQQPGSGDKEEVGVVRAQGASLQGGSGTAQEVL